MKKVFSKFNPNWIALAILVSAFAYSAYRFAVISSTLNSGDEDSDTKIVRITHWQLEPGFREAMQWAIDEYNALPEVQAAGVQVMQIPISERVYSQFMNVHLISGTAPDIAVKNSSQLIRGNALAKFYAPLGEFVDTPNPYNLPQFQADGLSPELSQFLEKASWRDTFFDGLQGGYEEELSDYYAVPICTWGGPRLIYNLSILKRVKAFARAAAEEPEQPAWLQQIWRTGDNPDGFIPESAGMEWLANDSVPETLGELFLYLSSVENYRIGEDIAYLTPVAASAYVINDVTNLYAGEFLSTMWNELSMEIGAPLTSLEIIAAYEQGIWSFDSPMLREYYNFVGEMTRFYPQGFLGLDREQAQRRFVLGQAAVLSTGGWDATSIYQGINERSNEEDRFEIAITPEPMPQAGERWADILSIRLTEADAKGGVPFAINKQSTNFNWALDFLQFISSHRINEGFAERAGWLPVISGARLPDLVAEFIPTSEGLPKGFALNPAGGGMPPNVRFVWGSSTKLFKTGGVEYETVAEDIEAAMQHPTQGAYKAWQTQLLKERDQSRANQRSMSVERLNAMLGSPEAAARERAGTYLNLLKDEGVHVRRWWHDLHPDEPYPAY